MARQTRAQWFIVEIRFICRYMLLRVCWQSNIVASCDVVLESLVYIKINHTIHFYINYILHHYKLKTMLYQLKFFAEVIIRCVGQILQMIAWSMLKGLLWIFFKYMKKDLSGYSSSWHTHIKALCTRKALIFFVVYVCIFVLILFAWWHHVYIDDWHRLFI